MFAEFQTYFLKQKLVFKTLNLTWCGFKIHRNTKYPQKVLPEGTLTSCNVLEFTYNIIGDPMWLLSILSGSPLFTE